MKTHLLPPYAESKNAYAESGDEMNTSMESLAQVNANRIIVYLSAIALAVMVDFCSQKLKGFRPLQALFVKKPESGNE